MLKNNQWLLIGVLAFSATIMGCSGSINSDSDGVNINTSSQSSVNRDIAVARYSSIKALPSDIQINPLAAVSQFKFTAYVHTVGQAITQVLQGSGYALASESTLPLEAREVMKKPLPITQRELGPLTTQDAVAVLIGQNVFTVLVDSLHRTVSFQLTPAYLTTGQDHE